MAVNLSQAISASDDKENVHARSDSDHLHKPTKRKKRPAQEEDAPSMGVGAYLKELPSSKADSGTGMGSEPGRKGSGQRESGQGSPGQTRRRSERKAGARDLEDRVTGIAPTKQHRTEK